MDSKDHELDKDFNIIVSLIKNTIIPIFLRCLKENKDIVEIEDIVNSPIYYGRLKNMIIKDGYYIYLGSISQMFRVIEETDIKLYRYLCNQIYNNIGSFINIINYYFKIHYKNNYIKNISDFQHLKFYVETKLDGLFRGHIVEDYFPPLISYNVKQYYVGIIRNAIIKAFQK
ncbi:MAG: hypothetical protein IKT40_09425 [Bacilli bacterium]|nr:hypothetical protein [Bacilli bacterium]